MKIIDNNRLCIEFKEMVDAIVLDSGKLEKRAAEDLRTASSRKTNGYGFIDDPTDARKVLLVWDDMNHKNQRIIKSWLRKRTGCKHEDHAHCDCGNPHKYMLKEPIRQTLTSDDKAEAFFLQYRYDGKTGKDQLPIDTIKKYSLIAGIYNAVLFAEGKKKENIKECFKIDVAQYWEILLEIVEEFKNADLLPAKFTTNYMNFRKGLNKYKEEGYASIIHPNFGNKSALKVNEDQLLYLIENNENYDDVLTCYLYNQWAKKNGHKTIAPTTVTNWRAEREAETSIGRNGNNAFNEKFIRQVKGLLPSVPLAMVEHDDNNLDLLFKDRDGYNFHKYVSIVVIDSRTRLVLGKSYTLGQSPQQWQIHHAYLDAMYYIRSLTGGWYLPFEIKADRWAHKSLTPFYNKIAKYIPPSHGNKHRGYIEQFFASPIWKRSQKLVSESNFSGNNMTAKYRGINEENLRVNANSRPLIGDDAEMQIENFFYLLRNMPDFKRNDMNALSKQEQFLEEWNKLSDADKRPITDEQFLITFGVKHNAITITNRGVEPQIAGCKYSYDLPEAWMYNKLIGEKVEILYDPFDMSRVLVTNNSNIRFIANTAELSPRALKDAYTGSRTYLNTVLTDKKEQVREMAEKSAKRKQIVDTRFYNAEAMLQGGTLIKELKNEAEHKLLEDFNQAHEAFIDSNNDLDSFFNQ